VKALESIQLTQDFGQEKDFPKFILTD